MTNSKCLTISAICAFVVAEAFAVNGVGNGNVQQVMKRSDGGFGGCMAYVTEAPVGVNGGTAPACGSFPGWISFSCTGDFNTKSEGQSAFDLANLALVTGNTLQYYVTDTQKHNGKCFAYDVRATIY
jgi:hypothetical protein